MPIPGAPVRRTTRPRPSSRSASTLLSTSSSRLAPDDGRGRHPGLALLGPEEARGAHGLLASLHGDLQRGRELEAVLEPSRGDVPDEDRARLRGRLQSGGDVRRVAERDGLRVGASDEPDRCRAAVHSHAHCESRDAPGGLDVTRIAGHDLEDA